VREVKIGTPVVRGLCKRKLLKSKHVKISAGIFVRAHKSFVLFSQGGVKMDHASLTYARYSVCKFPTKNRFGN
jgi:hypothetical protein